MQQTEEGLQQHSQTKDVLARLKDLEQNAKESTEKLNAQLDKLDKIMQKLKISGE